MNIFFLFYLQNRYFRYLNSVCITCNDILRGNLTMLMFYFTKYTHFETIVWYLKLILFCWNKNYMPWNSNLVVLMSAWIREYLLYSLSKLGTLGVYIVPHKYIVLQRNVCFDIISLLLSSVNQKAICVWS